MKIVVSLLGVLTILAGIWPILSENSLVPASIKVIPSSGMIYQGIIVVIGIIGLAYGLRKNSGFKAR